MDILFRLEEQVIQKHPNPEIVILGSSRARGAFLPTVMEEALGLPRGKVSNLAMGSLQILEAVAIYERNRAALRSARVVVVQIDAPQFSVGLAPTFRFRHIASWSDRMAYSGGKRLRLLADQIYATDHVIPQLSEYIQLWHREGHPPARNRIGIDRFGRLDVVLIGNDHDPRQFTDGELRERMEWFYVDYTYSPVFEAHLLRLLDAVEQDGGEVILVGMPQVPRYLELLRERHGDLYERFWARMQHLCAERAIGCATWDLPEQAGLVGEDFRDWGHLNTPGAVRWSKFFAAWLQRHVRPAPEAPEPSRAGESPLLPWAQAS